MKTILAPAKVNLCLFLGPARVSDGRHELVTVFQALTLADVLTVTPAAVDEVICPGVSGPNLALRALELLRESGWDSPPLRIEIDKRIPVAAGMGGGSADAAAVLSLAVGKTRPHDLAVQLGADVAALIEPGLWMAGGVGDTDLIHFPAGLGEHAYVVLPSAFALSTADVYREADRLGLARGVDELKALKPRVRRGLGDGRTFPPALIVNDLAPAALSLCPSIQDALNSLGEAGADQAIVSGSGPTCVGIWWGDGSSEAAQRAATALRARFPGVQTALPFDVSSQSARTR
jgi:4-diphosphocytidyl-2-C-methyl-D-erythritol kinase